VTGFPTAAFRFILDEKRRAASCPDTDLGKQSISFPVANAFRLRLLWNLHDESNIYEAAGNVSLLKHE